MSKRDLPAIVLLVLLAGCGSGDGSGSGASLAEGESSEEQRRLARAVLVRHDEQVSAPASVVSHGLSIDSAAVDARGTRMTVSFTGSPAPAARECGADYAAEPVESDQAVVVIVLEQPNGYRGVCTMMGLTRTAELNLAAPLGDRTVLSIGGEPVPVTRTTGTK